MSRRIKAARLILMCSLLLLLFVPIQSREAPERVDNRVIVKLKPGNQLSGIDAIRKDLGASVICRFKLIGAELWQISGVTVEDAIGTYKKDPRIEYIEPDYIVHALEVIPNDPSFNLLWGLHNTGQTGGTPGADIHAPEAWELETGDAVVLGVIDTGVDWNHPELSNNIWTNPGEIPDNGVDDDGNGYVDDVRGWDFVNNDNNPMDDHGHGTHVSGTIAAAGNNGIGVAGVSWSAKIMPLKFLDRWGSGSTSNAILAVQYATMMGARFTSNSWGGGAYSAALRDAIAAAGNAGMLFIAAAGNYGTDNDAYPLYPCSYDLDNIISVAATDHNDALASFSCYGARSVDLGAPGVGIYSCLPGNSYGSASGTSMATPHVSGAVSLFWSKYPSASYADVKARMLAAVDTIPALLGKTVSGGRLNAFKMLAGPDTTLPSAVGDLAATNPSSNAMTLTWTAPGDDGTSGTASAYDLRYSLSPIEANNFSAATRVQGAPHPLPAGSPETFTVRGLNFGTTYYFAIKAFDDWGNSSPVSNSPSGTTLGMPHIAVSPDALSDSLLTGETAVQTLTIENTEPATTLDFCISIAGVAASAARVDMIGERSLRSGVIARGRSLSAKELENLRALVSPRVIIQSKGTIDKGAPSKRGASVAGALERIDGVGVFGSMQNEYFGGLRTRGNIFACTASTRLVEHRFYMGPSSSTQLWFLVYEGESQVGVYNLVSASNVTPAGPGEGWYSSGNLNLPLEAGKYYLICASFEQESSYYNEMDITPYPIPASFGELIGQAGWYWAPSTSFPPSMTQDVSGDAFIDPVAYCQTIVTGVGTSWVSVAPECGTVPGVSSTNVAVTFDAAGLDGGDYLANIVVASNDSSNSTATVPAMLHVTGAPDIAVSDTLMNYGPLFLGATKLDTLVISNEGTDTLHVSEMALGGPDFSADTTPFDLGPREKRSVVVTFAPSAAGTRVGTLTITSNDPVQNTVEVALRGEGLLPPVISVAPDSLVDSLSTGETSTHTLTISNSGASDLDFSVTFEQGTSAQTANDASGVVPPIEVGKEGKDTRTHQAMLQAAGGPDPFGYRWRDSDEAGGPKFAWVDARLGTPVQLSEDQFKTGIPLGFTFNYYGQEFTSIGVGADGWLSFNGSGTGYPSYVPRSDGYAGAIAPFARALSLTGGYVRYLTIGTEPNRRFVLEYNHIRNCCPSGDNKTFEVILYENSNAIRFQYLVAPNDNPIGFGIESPDQTMGMGNGGSGALYISPAAVKNNYAIEFAPPRIWAGATPSEGTVPAGGSLDLTVRMDASCMNGGDYDANLLIANNDPAKPEVRVPARLHVTGRTIRLAAPNGGELLRTGDLFTISWVTDPILPDSVGIFLSLDGGAHYDSTIASGLAGVTSYLWRVAPLPSNTARIEVIGHYLGCTTSSDASDEDFTIESVPSGRSHYVSKNGDNIYPYTFPEWAARRIQDAVDAADPGDSVFVATGTYAAAVTVNKAVHLLGGWAPNFISRDPVTYATTISYSGSTVSFMNVSSGVCGIEGFSLTGGTGTLTALPVAGTYGGAVLSYLSSPIIRNNKMIASGHIYEFDYSAGGGIACYGGTPLIENNALTGCLGQCGGGIYLYQTNATLRHNLVRGSRSDPYWRGANVGGGIYAYQATAVLEGNRIEQNDGYLKGGGLYVYLGSASLSGDTICANDCDVSGGGVGAERSSLTIAHALFSRNTCGTGNGGGVFFHAGSLNVTNSLFVLNSANVYGGGLYADSTVGSLANNTLDRNTAAYAGNVYLRGPVSVDVRNNVMTHGTDYGFAAPNMNRIAYKYNNCSGNSPSDYDTVVPDSTNISASPLYADTAAVDYHLLVHSASIDAGDPAGLNDPDGSRADQGAYGGPGAVMAAPWYVKNLAAVAVNDTTIRLTWDPVDMGAVDHYAVYGSETAGFVPGESVCLGSTTSLVREFLHAPAVGCWYYRVSGVNALGYGGGYSLQAGACAAGPDTVPPTVRVVYPNGGEQIQALAAVRIKWHATDNRMVDSVSIYYSKDGGHAYDLIVHGCTADSTYDWTTPMISCDSCLVKVVAYDPYLLTGFDASDAIFSIRVQTGVGDQPRVFALHQNYPNPFNPMTRIAYSVKDACHMSVKIYDISGRLIRVLVDSAVPAGRYEVVWDGRDAGGRTVASGIYFYRLDAGSFRQTRKMVLLR